MEQMTSIGWVLCDSFVSVCSFAQEQNSHSGGSTNTVKIWQKDHVWQEKKPVGVYGIEGLPREREAKMEGSEKTEILYSVYKLNCSLQQTPELCTCGAK